MEKRIERLVAALPQDVDGVVITSPYNRYYFTGMRSSAGTLFITRETSYFIIDFRYIELAQHTISHCQVILQENLYAQMTEIIQRHGVKAIAVETSFCTMKEYEAWTQAVPGVHWLKGNAVDEVIGRLRSVKDARELEAIRAAQKITDEGFLYILNHLRPGLTERQVALQLEHQMLSRGGEKLAFDTICVSGVNSSLPHGVPGNKVIEAGDFVTLDFGVTVAGYCSDMTRTVAVGHATDEMMTIYNTVLQAQLAALDTIQVGIPCQEVDAAARRVIDQAGYRGCFGHGTGHAVGLEIHEDPRFSQKTGDICRAGLVMTVEPGIYLAGKFGCRIEDMVFIGEGKVENLTHSPKELIIL